jgi:hypothetical protein
VAVRLESQANRTEKIRDLISRLNIPPVGVFRLSRRREGFYGSLWGAQRQRIITTKKVVIETSALAQSEVHTVTPRLLANSEMS